MPRLIHQLFVLVAAVAFSFTSALAQPLANAIPDDALIYVGWSGASNLGPDYDASHLKAFLDKSSIRPFIERTIPAAAGKVAALPDSQLPVGPAEMHVIAMFAKQYGDQLLNRPMAIYVGKPTIKYQERPILRAAIIFDDVVEPQAVAALLNGGIQQMNREMRDVEFKFALMVEGKRIVIYTDSLKESEINLLTKGQGAKSVATTSRFKKASTSLGKNPAFVMYMDMTGANQLLEEVLTLELQNNPDNENVARTRQMKEDLGLNDLQSVLYSARLDGKGWRSTLHIQAPGQRKGLLKLLDVKPIDSKMIQLIPRDAEVAGAMQLDLAAAAREAASIVERTDWDGNEAEQFKQALQQADQFLGMSIMDEALPAFGQHWLYYYDAQTTGTGSFAFGGVMINNLRDPAKASAILDKLQLLAGAAMAQAPPVQDGYIKLKFRKEKVGDVEINYLALPLGAPTWAIHKGNLYFSLQPESVVSAVKFADSGKPSLVDHPFFKAQMKRMADNKVAGFSWYDSPKMMTHAYPLWQIVGRTLVGFADMLGVEDTPVMLLPTLPEILEITEPSVSFMVADEAGVTFMNYESYPFATVMAAAQPNAFTGINPTAAPLVVGAMLPALGAARKTANNLKDQTNMRGVMMIACTYASQDANQRLPEDLGHMYAEAQLDPKLIFSPFGDRDDVPRDFYDWSEQKQRDWINTNADYQLIGGGTKWDTRTSQIMLIPKPHIRNPMGGINVGFADTRVEFIKDVDEVMTVVNQYGGDYAKYRQAQRRAPVE